MRRGQPLIPLRSAYQYEDDLSASHTDLSAPFMDSLTAWARSLSH